MNIPSNVELLKKCCQRGSNCCIKLSRIEVLGIYKGEQLTQSIMKEQKKACDCFIFYDDSYVALVELKSRTIDYSSVQEKFDNGVEIVNLLLGAKAIHYKIVPVLLAKTFNKKPSGSLLARKMSVRINGKCKSIRYDKCGTQLADIMAKK